MSLIVDVKLWEQNVGSLIWNEKQDIAAFQYEPKFLRSKLDISPLMMPRELPTPEGMSFGENSPLFFPASFCHCFLGHEVVHSQEGSPQA